MDVLGVTAGLEARVALSWTFDMSQDRQIALCWAVGRYVAGGIVLQALDEIGVLAYRLDAESCAEAGELLALEAMKSIGRKKHVAARRWR